VTVDKSLKTKGQLFRRRNVLTREERLEKLASDGRWEEGESVFGLPKVSARIRRARAKKKKVAASAAEVPTPGTPAEQSAAETDEAAQS